jgi:prevent-host-death family protein
MRLAPVISENSMVDIPAINTISATEASTRLDELLEQAAERPVGITRKDELAAYLVSKQDFEALVAKIQELEDQLCLAKVEIVRGGGFLGADDVDALLNCGGISRNEEAGNAERGE